MASPDWRPLEAAVSADQMGDWMWMGEVKYDGHTIQQYKHRDTRDYVNLDRDGNAWALWYNGSGDTPSSAEKMSAADAIAKASR